MNNNSNIQDTTIEGERLIAFLMIDGKVYESDCDHQECLELYYRDKGIKSEFDYTDPDVYDAIHDAAIKKTYALKEAHNAYGFDLFDDYESGYVLLAHDKKTYDTNLDWMKEYQYANNECDITLGYFLNNENAYSAILTDDYYNELKGNLER